jgi:hypothetical protein
MQFSNSSDGTGESAVLKVDVSTLSAPPQYVCNRVRLGKIDATVNVKDENAGLTLLWDADADKPALVLTDGTHNYDFRDHGGLVNTATKGITGDIRFTFSTGTGGNTGGYVATLDMVKDYTPSAT